MTKWPKKARLFTFTNFDLTVDYGSLVTRKQAEFIAIGPETCKTTGRKHHQGYIYFVNAKSTSKKSLGNIGSMLGDAHMEPMLGSLHQNEGYCSKESSLQKWGNEPKQGTRSDLNSMVDRIRGGERVDDIVMEDPGFFHEFGRTLQKIEDVALRQKNRTEMTQGEWVWGPTGVGKSHYAFADFTPETHYVKPLQDEWWDGYTGQPVVILNDFRGQIPFSELLTLVDKYPHNVKRRCREPAPFLAKKLIVTSSLPPEDVYINRCAETDSLAQLTRRFRILKLEQKCPEGNTDTSVPRFDFDKKNPWEFR